MSSADDPSADGPPAAPAADAAAAAAARHDQLLQLAETRTGLARLQFLCGRWRGEGHSLGEPVWAEMTATLEVSGCVLLTREQALGPDGRPLAGEAGHADLAVYRWESSEQTLKVRHMQAPGVVQEYHVEPRDPADPGAGVRWNAGPFSPRVVLAPVDENTLVTEVWMAWRSAPDTTMRWTRIPPEPAR